MIIVLILKHIVGQINTTDLQLNQANFLETEPPRPLDLSKTNAWFHLKFMINGTILKVSKGAKIRNRYNKVPHLTQDTNGKVTNSQ